MAKYTDCAHQRSYSGIINVAGDASIAFISQEFGESCQTGSTTKLFHTPSETEKRSRTKPLTSLSLSLHNCTKEVPYNNPCSRVVLPLCIDIALRCQNRYFQLLDLYCAEAKVFLLACITYFKSVVRMCSHKASSLCRLCKREESSY